MIESRPHLPKTYQVWSLLLIGTIVVIDIFHRFYPRSAMDGAFDDDFFYYAQIARHLAHGGGSTFDGIHYTNGYHPLWLLCLTLFFLVGSGRLFFLLITVTMVFAIGSIFWVSLLCLRRLGVQTSGQYVIATLITFQSELLLRGGMEITLALPLILLLIFSYLDAKERDFLFFLRSGLLSSLCILSRLDSVILVFLLFGFAVWHKKHRSAGRGSIALFALGLTPLWAYLLLNKLVYGAFAPISAQAKQLRMHHMPQLAPLLSLIHPVTTVRLLVVVPGILSIIVLLVLLLRARSQLSSAARPVLWPIAIFPLVLFGLLCFLSDWPLWYWYFYPLLLCSFGCMAALAICLRPSSRTWVIFAIGTTFVSLGYTMAYNINRPPRKNEVFLAAQDIAHFAETHPGTYAMGDRSGTVAFLLSSQVIQLEGLVMDRAYLNRLRTQPPLISLLREYGVKYYVSNDATFKDGCYRSREPLQAGFDSPHMLGIFCQPPVATFTHGGVVTRLFNVADIPGPSQNF